MNLKLIIPVCCVFLFFLSPVEARAVVSQKAINKNVTEAVAKKKKNKSAFWKNLKTGFKKAKKKILRKLKPKSSRFFWIGLIGACLVLGLGVFVIINLAPISFFYLSKGVLLVIAEAIFLLGLLAALAWLIFK